MRTLKSTFYLTLFLLGGILFSGCDEFFAALDNPVSPNLKVRKSTLTIKVGNSTSCQATASTRAKITYASSDETVATVTDFGMVTGVSVGTAYITVLATNAEDSDLFIDESAVIAVNVIEDESKEQKKGTISYATTSVGKTFGDEPFTNPLTRTGDGKVTYASSNTAVAEVNATTGEVTIKGNGETTITATVTDSKKYTYEKKTATYTLGVGTATMTVSAEGFSGTYDEKDHGITVTVTSPSGATVKYGTAEGSYTLTASPTYTNAGTYTVYYQVTKTDYTTVTGSATVTINKAAGEIKFTQTSMEKKLGDSAFDSSLTMTNDPTATVTYSSDKPAVASVDANGRVSVNAGGTATITATVTSSTNYTYSPNYAEFTVKVTGMSDPDDYSNGGDPFGL